MRRFNFVLLIFAIRFFVTRKTIPQAHKSKSRNPRANHWLDFAKPYIVPIAHARTGTKSKRTAQNHGKTHIHYAPARRLPKRTKRPRRRVGRTSGKTLCKRRCCSHKSKRNEDHYAHKHFRGNSVHFFTLEYQYYSKNKTHNGIKKRI